MFGGLFEALKNNPELMQMMQQGGTFSGMMGGGGGGFPPGALAGWGQPGMGAPRPGDATSSPNLMGPAGQGSGLGQQMPMGDEAAQMRAAQAQGLAALPPAYQSGKLPNLQGGMQGGLAGWGQPGMGAPRPGDATSSPNLMGPAGQGTFAGMMGGQPGAQPQGDFASMLGRMGPQFAQMMQARRQPQQQMPQPMPIAGQGRQMQMPGAQGLSLANLMRQRQQGRMFSR